MVFVPKANSKRPGAWTLDPDLPKVKFYTADGRLRFTFLVREIIEKLPVKKFRDRVEFEKVIDQIFLQVWPKWDKYFAPQIGKIFAANVRRTVFKDAGIELADEKKNDNRFDTKQPDKTDGS